MVNKIKSKDVFIIAICLIAAVIIKMHQTSISGGGDMFSVENVVEVGLFCGIPVLVVLLVTFFSKNKKNK